MGIKDKEQYLLDKERVLLDKEKRLGEVIKVRREQAFSRFPLVFTLLGSFGLVATFYGFEGLIDRIPLLSDNPLILLGTGILTLVISGTLYKKLG